jgi:protein-tyrosine phosphatase
LFHRKFQTGKISNRENHKQEYGVINVLFVCMGNICRSPMAEGAFRKAIEDAGLKEHFMVDSAGTIGYHAGSAPDPRAQETAKKNDINISSQRSRKVTENDFHEFDYILAMDNENMADLRDRRTGGKADISLFLSHAKDIPIDEMPDPYYGHHSQFDQCYAAAVDASTALLDLIKKEKLDQ